MFEIGNSLREARLRQGLDFFEIEQSTKIRGKYLRALEDEQFEVLPAQTYVKGFLRSYADHLGLDGQLYVDEFNSRYVRGELEEEEEQRPLKPRVARPGRGGAFQNKSVMITLVAIAGLTIFVFAAWMWGGSEQPEHSALGQHAEGEEGAAEADGQARCQGRQGRGVRRRLPRDAHREADLRRHARERSGSPVRRPPSVGLRVRTREPEAEVERPLARRARRGDGLTAMARSDAPASPARGRARLKPRTEVLVTGSELIRGSRRDSNGPFLAEELTRLGLEPSSIRIVGDDQAELEPAIREGLEADLLVLSGGLGPTHDDRTVELLARAAGLEASVVPELEQEIEACLEADRGTAGAAVRGVRGRRSQAGDGARGWTRDRDRRDRSGARRRDERGGCRRPTGAAARVAQALAGGARGRGRPRSAGAGRGARAARVARVRGQRVGNRAGARRGRGRAGGRSGDDLRARGGDLGRALRRGRGAGGELSERARRGDLLRGRSPGRGARARPGRANAGSRSARRSRAPAGSSPRGSPRCPARATCSGAVSWRTTTR